MRLDALLAFRIADHVRECAAVQRHGGVQAANAYIDAIDDFGVRYVVRESTLAFLTGRLSHFDDAGPAPTTDNRVKVQA